MTMPVNTKVERAMPVIAEHFAQGGGTLKAEVFQDNAASASVLTSAGFRYRGEGEAYSVARGATQPTWRYDLERG